MKKILLFSFILVQSSCAFFLSYIKDKKPTAHPSQSAAEASAYMWEQFHEGNYDSIPVILDKLNQAYQEDPNNATVAAHLGFVYLWSFSERVRKPAQERVLENIFLSNRFFREAIVLNPHDDRLYGFQSGVQMCEGAMTNNLELLAQSYFGSLKAIRKWSQFNKFALGYIESQLDTGSRMYKQGLRYQWQIIDECSKKKLTEEKIMNAPETALRELYTEIHNSKDPEIYRACGNSEIAPHNWEGFFLNFGDMLVKAGKLTEAEIMYTAITYSPVYDQWAYKNIVHTRIRDMKENQEYYNRKQNLMKLTDNHQMMINSELSCTGCHAINGKEPAVAVN